MRRMRTVTLTMVVVLSVMALASCASKTASNGPLCSACEDMSFIANIGTCGSCSKTTSSGAFELCKTCAVAQGICQACGAQTR